MNRRLLLAVIIFVTLIFTACRSQNQEVAKTDDKSNTRGLEPVEKISGRLNIYIDPRIELLSAVQNTSGYGILTKYDYDYKSSMTEYFAAFDEHPAVRKFSDMAGINFSYDAPPAVMLYLSQPPVLGNTKSYTSYLLKRGGGKRSLDDFTLKLSDFAREADFNGFYEANTDFYNAVVNKVFDDVAELNLEGKLTEYYGMNANSYNLILAPMFHPGGYGIRVESENAMHDVYAIIGPTDIYNQTAGSYNKLPGFSKENIVGLVWHEFSHSFVNPTTEKNLREVNKYSKLFKPIKDIMSKQAYNNWEICVNEHIVRAVTTRMAYVYEGKKAGDISLAYEKSCGFYYVEALSKSLEIYEKNRDKYPTFEEYYPELIKVFKELAEKDLGKDFYSLDFQGPINATFTEDNLKSIVLILPTNEKDKEAQEKIKACAELIKSKILTQGKILTDKEALQQDLSNNTIISYGTLEGNLWLAKYKADFPFVIEEDKVIADKTYEGTDMALISGLPNPLNYRKPLIVYTAQVAENVVDLNSVFHGPTDYIILKAYKEISKGNYVKNNGKWVFE